MSPTVVISGTFLPGDALRLPWRLFQAWQSVMGPAVWTHVLGTDLYKTHFWRVSRAGLSHICLSGLFPMTFSSAGDFLVLFLFMHNGCVYSFMLVFWSLESL